MVNDVLSFKKLAIQKGLCSAYTKKWNDVNDKKDLMRIALDSNGIEYICESIKDKWGLSSSFIGNNFSEYINGKYLVKYDEGYTSEMYCQMNGDIEIRATSTILIDCKADLIIEPYSVSKIYVCGDSSEISFSELKNSKVYVYVYGDSIVYGNDDNIIIERYGE